MKKSSLVLVILSILLFSTGKLVSANSIENDISEKNQMKEAYTAITEELKKSEYVYSYEENAEEITFYIEEPAIDNSQRENIFESYSFRAANNRAGVTKIVFQKGTLNFKLYLSADHKTKISKMSNSGAMGFLTYFIGGGPWLSGAVSAITALLPEGKTYTYGSVYVFKNGTYKYSYYQ